MEKSDWIIELNKELTNEVEASHDEQERWKRRSIYKIPAHAVNLNKEAYKPWLLALGPFHQGDEHLERMEDHKKRALRHFLQRSQKPLERYVDALAEAVHDLMDSYDRLDTAWKQDPKGFLKLMIVDGCFILETMRAATRKSTDKTVVDYDPNDLIFSKHGKHNTIPCLKRDMLLLENQVPLLVLERLLAVETDNNNIKQNEEQVTKLILEFYDQKGIDMGKIGKCQHILDVFRKSLIWEISEDKVKYKRKRSTDLGRGRSAREIKEAGIQFRASDSSLKDISFSGRTLKLPKISLDDTTESTYLNMVAFERLHVGAGNDISCYIFFMNRLLNDVEDVRLLKSQKIISSFLGCDEDVRNLFINLSKEILFDSNTKFDDVYSDIEAKLRNYFKKTLYKWRYNLIHTYFRNPWAIVSVIAGIFIFGLTITQTLYGILSFVHGKH